MTSVTGTILVVDDDLPTQKLLEALMRRHGLNTQIAGNGGAAIELLRKTDFACIILDLMMPVTGGKDVIAYLTAEGRKTPVIVCTAAGPRSTDGFDSAIVRSVVRKPFDIDQLAALVKGLVQGE